MPARYKYIIPAKDCKPLISIPKELKDNLVSLTYGTDEIVATSNKLIDTLLYDTNVRVFDLVSKEEITNIFEYKHPGTKVIIVKDNEKIYAFAPATNWKGYKIFDYGNAGTIDNPEDDASVVNNVLRYYYNICAECEIYGNINIENPVKFVCRGLHGVLTLTSSDVKLTDSTIYGNIYI